MITCKGCGRTGFFWTLLDDDRHVLVDTHGVTHACPVYRREKRRGLHLSPGRAAQELDMYTELYGRFMDEDK